LFDCLGMNVHAQQPVACILALDDVNNLPIRVPGIAAQPLHPGRPQEGFIIQQNLFFATLKVQQNQLVPLPAVGNVTEGAPIRRKCRLKDWYVLIAVQLVHFNNLRWLTFQEGKHQAGAVPRHIGVIPLHPGNGLAIRAPNWLHVEICALDEVDRPVFSLRIHQG